MDKNGGYYSPRGCMRLAALRFSCVGGKLAVKGYPDLTISPEFARDLIRGGDAVNVPTVFCIPFLQIQCYLFTKNGMFGTMGKLWVARFACVKFDLCIQHIEWGTICKS
jgi:hypothetical protein